MQLSFNQNKANLHTDRKGRRSLPHPSSPHPALTARELAEIQADERPDVGAVARRREGGGGGGTGDAEEVWMGGREGEGRGRRSGRGGNMAGNKQNPN